MKKEKEAPSGVVKVIAKCCVYVIGLKRICAQKSNCMFRIALNLDSPYSYVKRATNGY